MNKEIAASDRTDSQQVLEAAPPSMDRLATPFDSNIASHMLTSPAASERSEGAGQSPRPAAPSSAEPLSNGSLKKITCTREETLESLTAKVSSPHLPMLQRMCWPSAHIRLVKAPSSLVFPSSAFLNFIGNRKSL